MSWETINQILGLATLDGNFCQELLEHPVEAAQKKGFTLTQKEEEVFSQIAVTTLPELTQFVFEKLAPSNGTSNSKYFKRPGNV